MLVFTENMTEQEKKAMFYNLNIESGLSEDEARQKAEDDFTKYKNIMDSIQNQTDDVSVIEVEKGGTIVKKTGKFTKVQNLAEIS